MNYGIGNVKAKSSGGGIPSIYIADSQVSVVGDDVSIQFTQAQFDVINANSVIYIEWESGMNTGVFEKTEETDIALLNYWWNSADNELQMTKIYVNDTTLIGEVNFNANILSGGGTQLYQHFYEYANTSNNKYCSFNIINEQPTMTYAEIISYFMTKGWTSYDNSVIVAIGGNNSAGAVSFGKVYYDSGTTNLKWLKMFQSANFDLLNPSDSTASIYAKITSLAL